VAATRRRNTTLNVSLDAVRRGFAQRIARLSGVTSPALLRAFATVPREAFVGPGPWRIMSSRSPPFSYDTTPDEDPAHLYDNVLVALDETRRLNNGEPAALMQWLTHLDLHPGARFLHVGCGVGYYTAIAAVAVSPGGRTVAVEVDAFLGSRARDNLARFADVEVIIGDGTDRRSALFDAVFVNAGATEPLAAWLDCLAEGGRLLVPLTASLPVAHVGFGQMLLVTSLAGRYDAAFVSPVGIFHCESARTREGDDLLREAYARGGYERVTTLRRDDHAASAQCWLHARGWCLSTG
jgi:protein-L-isoaspartate(D-aspartate) O-methyltransferase